jgi:hypothetical protein
MQHVELTPFKRIKKESKKSLVPNDLKIALIKGRYNRKTIEILHIKYIM